MHDCAARKFTRNPARRGPAPAREADEREPLGDDGDEAEGVPHADDGDQHHRRADAGEHPAPAALGAPEDEEERARERRPHVAGAGDHRLRGGRDARRGIGEAAGVAEDLQSVDPGAEDHHEERVRRLVQPGREDLERVERDPAVGHVPQDQRDEERHDEELLLSRCALAVHVDQV